MVVTHATQWSAVDATPLHYVAYYELIRKINAFALEKEWEAMRETTFGGHACEWETTLVLGAYPHLVKMDQVPDEPAIPLNRMQGLPPTFTGVGWYSDYPNHYAGDARSATEAKGQALVRLEADCLAQYIAAVKADEVVPMLQEEFFHRVRQVGQD